MSLMPDALTTAAAPWCWVRIAVFSSESMALLNSNIPVRSLCLRGAFSAKPQLLITVRPDSGQGLQL